MSCVGTETPQQKRQQYRRGKSEKAPELPNKPSPAWSLADDLFCLRSRVPNASASALTAFALHLRDYDSCVDCCGATISVCDVRQVSTFAQPSATTFGEYDYTRSGNPTRLALEKQVRPCSWCSMVPRGFLPRFLLEAVASFERICSVRALFLL